MDYNSMVISFSIGGLKMGIKTDKHNRHILPCGCKVGIKFTNLCEVLHTSTDRPPNEMAIVKQLKSNKDKKAG